MDGEELATPSQSATPSHAVTAPHKVKRELTAEEKKERNFSQRQNRQKRLKNAEALGPDLSTCVKIAEKQNIALSARGNFASICLRSAWRLKRESAPLLNRDGARQSKRSEILSPLCQSQKHGPLL